MSIFPDFKQCPFIKKPYQLLSVEVPQLTQQFLSLNGADNCLVSLIFDTFNEFTTNQSFLKIVLVLYKAVV